MAGGKVQIPRYVASETEMNKIPDEMRNKIDFLSHTQFTLRPHQPLRLFPSPLGHGFAVKVTHLALLSPLVNASKLTHAPNAITAIERLFKFQEEKTLPDAHL